ncbi:hypothetical protein CDV55_100813 [Aspergillus turcosus]|nr:hypothetical protein CDV55_100813 [Aspergillus turcosus]
MKTQTFLLLLGGLASLALADSDCQTIINCKSTATVTSTVIPPASTVTVTNTITLTPSCSPTACPTLSCPPCPSVTTPGTTSGTPAPAAPTCTTTVQDWKRADVKWTSDHPKPGAPAPAMFSSNFNYETILTLTDDSTSLERFEVYQDYKFLGKTSEATAATKGKIIHNAVEAIKLGYSHASFNIPAGPHTFMVTWQDAANNPETKEWTSGAFQYRFQRVEPYFDLCDVANGIIAGDVVVRPSSADCAAKEENWALIYLLFLPYDWIQQAMRIIRKVMPF